MVMLVACQNEMAKMAQKMDFAKKCTVKSRAILYLLSSAGRLQFTLYSLTHYTAESKEEFYGF